jgi:hypothetical protein
MNSQTALFLLNKLLQMNEFPNNSLPSDCERRADYVWQRSSTSYQKKSIRCNYQYPGIDFIWMASLLISSMDNKILSEINRQEYTAHFEIYKEQRAK